MTHAYVWHDSCICVTWLMHMCDMTHAYVWHDSYICVTWLMPCVYVRCCTFMSETWLMHTCHMTHTFERVTSKWTSHVTHLNESHHTYRWNVSHIETSRAMSHMWMRPIHGGEDAPWCVKQMRRITHINESCHTWKCAYKLSKLHK